MGVRTYKPRGLARVTDKAQQAGLLRAQGLSYKQIAERMGVTVSSVGGWLKSLADAEEDARHLARKS